MYSTKILHDSVNQIDSVCVTWNITVVVCSCPDIWLQSFGSLSEYPAIAAAFRKANTTLPSSAAVERLFSAAAQVLTACRSRLSDETMDKLMFLRSVLKIGPEIYF